MHKSIPWYLLLLVAFTPVSHAAQTSAEDWFEIEVLLFKRNQPEALDEQWPQQGNRVIEGRSLELIEPFAGASQVPTVIDGGAIGNRLGPLSVLSESALQLNQQWNQLRNNALFTPLLHVGWRQHVAPARTAEPVHLFAGRDFSGSFAADGTPTTGGRGPVPLWELDGLFRVHLQHYLYIDTQLLLRAPGRYRPIAADLPAAATGSETDVGYPGLRLGDTAVNDTAITEEQPFLLRYPLDQQRRVRSGEIHYFDHPQFGMIVQIRRIP